MSVQPSRARWCTRLLPTIPAPMTTTLALEGTVAMLLAPRIALRITHWTASYETFKWYGERPGRCQGGRGDATCRGFYELVVARKGRHVQVSPVDRGNPA